MSARKDLAPQLADLQARLQSGGPKRYWRTLEELSGDPAFEELLQHEFPEQTATGPGAIDRRNFLALMGASLALGGLSGCSVRPAPSGEVVPAVRAPEEIVPGRPLFFATAMALGGSAVGLLVESHMGRPTKIEGNPEHPASLGATDPFHQASILGLYDPDRSQNVTLLGQTSTWDAALGTPSVGKIASVTGALNEQRKRRGAGLRILTESIVSPTLARQIERLLREFPEAHWHQYEPVNGDAARQASRLAFDEDVHTTYRFHDLKRDRRLADVVLSLDADFLSCGSGSLRYVAEFMAGRRVRTGVHDSASADMNRLYVVEPGLTCTGAKADNRLAVPAREVEAVARAVASRLGIRGAGPVEGGPHAEWAAVVARDLERHPRRCAVLAGERQPPVVHLLAQRINRVLDNVGNTVVHTAPVEARPVDHLQSLRELVKAMDHGDVEVLIVLGANPVYTAPADFAFVERMQKVPLRVHLGLYQDETARQCHWHLPEAHYLEAWGDARAYDGTASVVQPLIAPLYQGRSAIEVVSALAGPRSGRGYDLVRETWRGHWQERGQSGPFEDFWQRAVHDGVIEGTAYPPRTVRWQDNWERHLQTTAAASDSMELVFAPDPTIYDGRFANNGWLQELPKPITSLTWDNAALMSPATAKELGIELGAYAHGGEHGGFEMPVVELKLGDPQVRAAAWIVPGHADRSITVALGYGRTAAGRVGGGPEGERHGFNAYELRTSERPWFAEGLAVTKTDDKHMLACTQQHQLMENRETVRSSTLPDYRKAPGFAAEPEEKQARDAHLQTRRPLDLYPERDYGPPLNKWGMVIDLTACTGCKACVVACQAENNIPVVGKDQVLAGREMHWLRVDRYNEGPYSTPEAFFFQPVPCMHCENAPCEYVCPVEATVHSADGLNDMVYQRCVGTRFCSNNCPYKVRRFNFFHYADYETPSIRLQYNPDVTVRSRGVMEKCSYCVQRIRRAQIDAQVEGREIIDQEVLTACQAACPAGAIVFGDLNHDGKSGRPLGKAYQATQSPLHYGLLAELNTKPRTTYLAALRNPNPDLEEKRDGH